jgi:hypothetical protein
MGITAIEPAERETGLKERERNYEQHLPVPVGTVSIYSQSHLLADMGITAIEPAEAETGLKEREVTV